MRQLLSRSLGLMAFLGSSVMAGSALAANFENAPPAFAFADGQAVPIDITNINLDLNFDAETSKTTGTAVVDFVAAADGYPFFDLVPTITAVKIDGNDLSIDAVPVVSDPNGVTKLRVLNHKLTGGETHQLTITYDLTAGVTYTAGAVKAGFFMTDLRVGGRGFWEQYGPSNYEFDQFKQTIHMKISNPEKAHWVYTNANLDVINANEWILDFDDYYTTSSFYVHIVPQGRFIEKKAVYEGKAANIPVLVYAEAEENAEKGLDRALRVLAENENTFGPYTHPKALAYVTPDGGGMEYAGATMTSMRALEHEFTHFWFARGVMPANGNAGWIDEAVASWRDGGYRRAASGPGGSAHNLGGFSPYRRHTTEDAYSLGRDLIGEFDKQFESFSLDGQTGMRGILRALFAERQRTTITVDVFKQFLERTTGADLTDIFSKYVYGVNAAPEGSLADAKAKSAYHPRPYTEAELARFR